MQEKNKLGIKNPDDRGGEMKKHDFKKYYSQKYNVKTKGVIVPLLDGTIGFMGEDEKQYNTTKEDLLPIEEIGL